ncbi:hydantoinase/oxoprolinase family protein [Hydrogenophaga sp. OTU3427]|uniref:hydantoinase/oxoprolinase family protein n=1 Tax=Hydrogenophaga sp. OTU3427 TaxID=3043856 RepID=UPI00313DEC2A
MSYRIGVDIGGTFTDLALVDDESGRVFTHKLLTTPDAPERAVIDGVAAILQLAGGTIDQVGTLVHGTTLVTNALIERRGCKVAMLVTRGFRDTLDMGRETRYDLYDLRLRFAPPLIERSARIEVDERIDYQGRVVRPLNAESIVAPLAELVARERPEAIAICLLHSYVDATHERQLAEIVRREHPGLQLSLSGEGYPVIREYERWTTTALNAYVQPLVDRYLTRLEQGLNGCGFGGRLFIMASNGGTLTPDIARRFPSRLLESGPAAGILMSAAIGRALQRPDVLAYDMGGTTAKGALISDGQPMKRYELEVAHVHHFRSGSGLTMNLPVLDMIEIGAGGGSLAGVDERGMLRVGPTSAGAVPGPVCYGRGGTKPALTDANLVLGYLDSASFLGGRMSVDADAARQAIATGVAIKLDTDATRAAWGIHEVVNENVAGAFRVHASERGVDVRQCTMVAFGGCGPLHAVRVARKLKVPTVVLPPAAGVMSALGLLISPLSFEVGTTRVLLWDEVTVEVWTQVFGLLRNQAGKVLGEAGLSMDDMVLRGRLELRYAGQGYEMGVDVDLSQPAEWARDAVAHQFEEAYVAVFGLALEGQQLEVVQWRLEAVSHQPAAAKRACFSSYEILGDADRGSRPAFDPEVGDFVEHRVIDRYRLAPGAEFSGPALVEEMESTTVIGTGVRGRVDEQRNLILELQ